MDKKIGHLVKDCRGCAPAAKLLMIKSVTWIEVDVPWSWLHVDFVGPLNGSYYLVLVDSFSKCPKIYKCKKPTSSAITNFLHELLVRFGILDAIVSDSSSQFVSFELKKFCKMFTVEHISTEPYHPRSNGQVDCFIDTLKWAQRKSNKKTTDEVDLQQFLRV